MNNQDKLKPHEDKDFIEDILKHIPKKSTIQSIINKQIQDMDKYELLLYLIYETAERIYNKSRNTMYYDNINMFIKENILKHQFGSKTIYLYDQIGKQEIVDHIKNNLDTRLFNMGIVLINANYRTQIDIHYSLTKELQLISAELMKNCIQSQLKYFKNGNIYTEQRKEKNKKTNKLLEPKLDRMSYKVFEKAINKKKILKSSEALYFLDYLKIEYSKKETESNKTIFQDYIYLILNKVKDPSKELIAKSLKYLQRRDFDLGFGIIHGNVFYSDSDTDTNIYDKDIINQASAMPTFSSKKENIAINNNTIYQLYQYLIFLHINKKYPYRKELIDKIIKWLKEDQYLFNLHIPQKMIKNNIECLQSIDKILYDS